MPWNTRPRIHEPEAPARRRSRKQRPRIVAARWRLAIREIVQRLRSPEKTFIRISLLIACTLLPAKPTFAQGDGGNPNLFMGGYKAPSLAQRHDCYVRILTRKITLDTAQRAAVSLIVTDYMFSQPRPPTTDRNAWVAREAKRNNEILRLLKTKADSDKFEDNRKREHAWFSAGNCHG
jgi:hypothetical protein